MPVVDVLDARRPVAEPGDLVTSTDVPTVTLKPGGRARMTVKIERRNKFNGRVPLDLLGLPHGVQVLDIGLNGILILPGQTERRVTLYADPWVKPTERPIVVLAKREGKNAQHAAKPVMLRVE